MAKNCPVCNFLNPYGAQICGECGNNLADSHRTKKSIPEAKYDMKRVSIGLRRVDKENKSLLIFIFTLCLFVYGLVILILSLTSWFRPLYGIDFIKAPEHLYSLILGIFLGLLTIFLAYEIYSYRKWSILFYFIWTGIHVLLLLMFRVIWWRPKWFSIKCERIFVLLILIELLVIPIVLKLKKSYLQGGG